MNSSIRDRSRERLREEERDNSSRSQRDRARDRDSSENGDRDPKKDNLDHYDGSRSRGHGEMLRDEYRRRGYDDDGGRDDHRKRERDKSRRDNNSRNPHLERDNEINDRDTKRGNSSVKNDSKQQASSTNYDRLKPRLEAFAKLLTGTNKSNIRRDLEQSVKANVKLQAVNIQHQAAQSSQGAVVKDSYSRGVKPDLVSDRDKPYHCEVCRDSFMVATQLSDHLRIAHLINRHASLLKPNQPPKLSLDEDGGNDDDSDED